MWKTLSDDTQGVSEEVTAAASAAAARVISVRVVRIKVVWKCIMLI